MQDNVRKTDGDVQPGLCPSQDPECVPDRRRPQEVTP